MTPTHGTRIRPRGRQQMRRVVIGLPNGLTLANLFLGVFAIVAASRQEFGRAGMYVVLGGVFDALDGRVARATGSGSRFGSELDSLVDAISFGLAPAMIMYFAVLNQTRWDWIIVWWYTACACIRLARFNVEQAGRAKKYFHGLPSPAAGLTLATYYWFSQTPLYTQTMIADLQWHTALLFLMAGLGFLMISDVSYPAVPTVGFRRPGEIAGTLVVVATIIGVFFLPRQFFFPAGLAYVLYGVFHDFVLGLFGHRSTTDADLSTDVDDDEETDYESPEPAPHHAGAAHLAVPAPHRRRRRRRPRGDRPDHPHDSSGE